MSLGRKQFAAWVVESGLLSAAEVASLDAPELDGPDEAQPWADELVRQKKLTAYQAHEIYAGRGKSLVLGNYVVLDKLGQGGMGVVLLARHRRMGRIVALKAMSPQAMNSPDAVRRFQREAMAAAKLVHPNIVHAYDSDEAAATHFLVMEYVEGTDLLALVQRTGPLAVATALNYVLQAARGLAYAHEQGVVHRDIKPSNLLLDAKGTVKILDMGLARIQSTEQADLTGSGEIMGTVDYMAPEQAVSTRTADGRADIYSLGMTLFYLLTGRVAYGGETMVERLMAHQSQSLPGLAAARSDVPQEVVAVFERMAAKSADERYPTMAAAIVDLERCGKGCEGSDLGIRDSGSEMLRVAELAGTMALGGLPPVREPALVATLAPDEQQLTPSNSMAETAVLASPPPVRPKPQPQPQRVEPSLAVQWMWMGGGFAVFLAIPVMFFWWQSSRRLPPPRLPDQTAPYSLEAAEKQREPTVRDVAVKPEPSGGSQGGERLVSSVPDPGRVISRDALESAQRIPGLQATWSPDGKELARTLQGRLERIDLQGGAMLLAEGGGDAVWSPLKDGPIAFVRNFGQADVSGEEIWLVDADGQNARKLVEGGYPTWHRDGQRLFYRWKGATGQELRSLDLSDSEAQPETLLKMDHPYPAVSPDGSLVALQEFGYMVVRRLDGPDKPANREPNEIVAKYMANGWHGLLPTWSPDSRFVTFGTFGRGDEKGLHLLDVAANQEQIIIPGSLTLARWSPDGKHLAMDDRVKGEIVIVDISGLNLAEKTPADDSKE